MVSRKEKEAILELVREGVRKFALSQASISEFYNILLEVDKSGANYRHVLSGRIFREIIKTALHERKQSRVQTSLESVEPE